MQAPIALLLLLTASSGCSKDPYDEARDEFIAGCEETSGSEAACICVFDKLSRIYSRQDFIAMYQNNYPPEDFVQNSMRASQQCWLSP